jgi:hypothetical protein
MFVLDAQLVIMGKVAEMRMDTWQGKGWGKCNGRCGGDVCGPWRKGSHLGSRGS